MSSNRLRTQCVSLPEKTVLVTCSLVDTTPGATSSQLIGHAFASVWDYSPSSGEIVVPQLHAKLTILGPGSDPANHTSDLVGWVTQLVVDKSVRRRYIATSLLQTLKSHKLFASVTAVGLVSSHPAACNVLAKYACKSMLLPSYRYPD